MKVSGFTVSKKLYTGFLFLIILLGFLGGSAIYSMDKINKKSIEITTLLLPGVQAINNINYLREHILALEYKYISEPDKNELIKLEEEMDSTFSTVQKTFEEYEATIFLEEERQNFEELKQKWLEYEQLHKTFLQIGSKTDVINGAGKADDDRLTEILDESQIIFSDMQKNLDFLVNLNGDGVKNASVESGQLFASSFNLIIIIFVIGIIGGLITAYIIGRTISKPLQLVTENVREVANGNLKIDPVHVKNKDEIGDLAQSINEMTNNLGLLIGHAIQTSESLAASSEQLLASSEQTSQLTQQVNLAIQEVASGSESQVTSINSAEQSVVEISEGMRQVAYSIQTVSELSMETNQKAEAGTVAIKETIEQMDVVQENITKTAIIIHALKERSKEIGRVVDLISNVSDQTNLLALNAAIEAARAGEQGKGFSVVANEVRKLAEESGKETKNIRTLIEEIQKQITQVSFSMEEGSTSLKAGVNKVNKTEKSFNEIAKMVAGITDQAREVSVAVEEVNASSEEIVQIISAITSISKRSAENTQHVALATEEQNATMEEIAASTNELSIMAQGLQGNISKFKV
ncbi:methyl-accepting chemotaxis protein [Domibacillus robiginosus]|uniref:methyl-accepting chemotaxis protein n=1 Tax=Domibacillus robiginosus TaxID=1071054 RepID=UPI00067D28ED|nr:HAMP domain-containing methyl-accepting chemotaxis protein [Domibacillus robiginosus]